MEKEAIHTPQAPAAIGPYSQAVKCGGFVFASGQIPITLQGSVLVTNPVSYQTRQVLENIKAVLEGAGTTLEKVVKTTVYLVDMNDFAEMNKTYGEFFREPFPARACVQVAALPKNVKIEIEAIACS